MRYFWQKWALILLLTAAFFVRLYRLPQTQTFLEDEGRDSLIVLRMIDTKKPVLIGPQTSTGNMYLGPLYYYLMTPALLASRMNPLGPVVMIAISGVLTVYLLYRLGKKWFGPRLAYLAATLYALMPLPVQFTRNSWNPNLAPLVSLLIIWLLSTLHRTKHFKKVFFGLGLLVGALVQLHYMTLMYVAFIGVIILALYYKQIGKLLMGTLLAFVGFVLILSPFFVFEVRNNFVNIKAMTRFIEAKDEPNIRYSLPLSLWASKVGKTTERLFTAQWGRGAFVAVDPFAKYITVVGVGLALFILFWQRRQKHVLLLAFILIGNLLALGIYQENIHLHYLGYLFPLMYLYFASGVASRFLPLRIVTAAYIIITFLYSFPTLTSYLNSGPTNQVSKIEKTVAYIVAKAGGRPYNLVSASSTQTTPFQYFAYLSSNRPQNTLTSLLYLVCQDRPCNSEDTNSTWMFITGPSHPTVTNYLGHPLFNYFGNTRRVISMEHVNQGIWVAELEISK